MTFQKLSVMHIKYAFFVVIGKRCVTLNWTAFIASIEEGMKDSELFRELRNNLSNKHFFHPFQVNNIFF